MPVVRPENNPAVALLLALCGGFLDAFTYFGHGHVFATAMTGNVVLLGVSAATGKWTQSFDYLRPILAFLLGVAVAQVVHLPRFRKWIPHAPVAVLTLEILFLLIAGSFPKEFAGNLLVLGISFVGALQSSTFGKVGNWSYNSTMTTGNLRIFGQAMFQTAFGARDPDSMEKARTFAGISSAFLFGAILGGLSTAALDNRALWIVDLVLLALAFRLFVALSTSADSPSGDSDRCRRIDSRLARGRWF
jgi:uncharacterized membrane protein YoaK (UPF0700 family)